MTHEEIVEEMKKKAREKQFIDSWNLEALYLTDVDTLITTTAQRLKADWLRSEIEKLKKKFKPTQIIDNGDGICTRTDMYIQGQNDDLNFGYNQAITSIITRYEEELLELEKKEV